MHSNVFTELILIVIITKVLINVFRKRRICSGERIIIQLKVGAYV